MSDSVQARLYQQGDEAKIVELLSQVFNGWPHIDIGSKSSLDHWYWKFRDNPTGKRLVRVGVVGDRIIACDHGLYTRWKIGEETKLICQGVDAAVHPEYRGKGVYSKIESVKGDAEFVREIGMGYSFSNVKMLLDNWRKKGLPIYPTPVCRLLNIRDVGSYINGRDDMNWLRKNTYRLGITAVKLGYRIISLFSGGIKAAGNIQIADVGSFDEDFDGFYDSIKDEYKLIAERNRAYLNWRYSDPRGGRYTVSVAKERGKVVGYIVYNINSYGGGRNGYVLDLFTSKKRLDIAYSLVKHASDYFDREGVKLVEYMVLKGHPYASLFRRMGYIDSMKDTYITYFLYREGEITKDVLDYPASEVLFQTGDTDWR
jgi:GNAT superfamily N-acetyltransferase